MNDQQRKNVKHGMPRGHVSQWAEGVCYCYACMETRGTFDDDRGGHIQIISSDPRAKSLTLKVIGDWGKRNA